MRYALIPIIIMLAACGDGAVLEQELANEVRTACEKYGYRYDVEPSIQSWGATPKCTPGPKSLNMYKKKHGIN